MQTLYKCVWMTAGVLSYRLCDRDFDCDQCLVDRALREGSALPRGEAAEAAARPSRPAVASVVGGLRYRRNGFYHPRHVWARVEGEGIVRIGIDDLARRLLGRLRRIELPKRGSTVRVDEPAWILEGDAGRVPLPSPIEGSIVARNESLLARPELIGSLQDGEVWLGRVQPNRLQDDLKGLLYGKRVAGWFREEVERIRAVLVSLRAVDAGALPNGGLLDLGILDRCDPAVRRVLIAQLLLGSDQNQKGR